MILPVTGTKVAGVWRVRGLSGSANTVWAIRKDLMVLSQWAHITRNWECPQAGPAWPVAMAAKPVKGRRWRKVPLLRVAAFSVKCGLGKTETGTAAKQDWHELVRFGEFETHC
jgi:hypothetical protein